MGQAVDAYISAKDGIASIENVRVSWKAATPYWDKMPVSRVDVQTSVDYRKHRAHCKALTVRNELAIIRAALNWAERHKLIGKAPFIQMPPLPASSVGHITKAEFRKLLTGAISPHIKLFMMIAVG
ncbi:hypothetical protein, partial [Bacillus thuringiensis]|uniref:hypothetical protein n=1 Tax=Bacillus thuringiensis TaxID=1428 RepID=UPI002175AD16